MSSKDKGKIINLSKLLGKIYQITDDILDASSNEKELGKTCGKDKEDEKATYLSLMSLVEAKRINEKLFNQTNKEINKESRTCKTNQPSNTIKSTCTPS